MSTTLEWIASPRRGPDPRVLLASVLLVIAVTPGIESLDLYIARQLFNSGTGEWLVPAGRPPAWYLFYNVPRLLVALTGGCLLVALAASIWTPRLRRFRVSMLLCLLAVILTPSLVSWLKHATDIYCPYQTEIFGGRFPHIGLLEAYPLGLERAKPGQCWPAGHASGGFGLMGFILFAAKTDWRSRLLLSLPGFAIGWSAGLFQMARGNHYLSHTIASLSIALLIVWSLEEVHAYLQIHRSKRNREKHS